MKNIALIILGILGVIMLYLGYKNSMLPPALTGVGFLLISFVLWNPNLPKS